MASSDWAKDISEYSQKEREYAAGDSQHLFLIKTKLEAMLKREKKYDIFMKCMEFVDTRIELDNLGIDKIFDHSSSDRKSAGSSHEPVVTCVEMDT